MELTSLEGALEVPGKLALFILLRLAFRLESAPGDPQWFTGLSPASLWAVTSTEPPSLSSMTINYFDRRITRSQVRFSPYSRASDSSKSVHGREYPDDNNNKGVQSTLVESGPLSWRTAWYVLTTKRNPVTCIRTLFPKTIAYWKTNIPDTGSLDSF